MSSLMHTNVINKSKAASIWPSIEDRLINLEKFILKSSTKKIEEISSELEHDHNHIERILTIVENAQKNTNETLDAHMVKILTLEAENQKLHEENKNLNEGLTALSRHVHKMMEDLTKFVDTLNK